MDGQFLDPIMQMTYLVTIYNQKMEKRYVPLLASGKYFRSKVDIDLVLMMSQLPGLLVVKLHPCVQGEFMYLPI